VMGCRTADANCLQIRLLPKHWRYQPIIVLTDIYFRQNALI